MIKMQYGSRLILAKAQAVMWVIGLVFIDRYLQKLKNIKLKFKEKRKKFNPNIVYKGQPNPTKL